MIEAVIFDMDGVLIDSEELWEETGKQVLAGLGHVLGEEQWAESLGLRSDEMVEYWFRHLEITTTTPEKLLARYDGIMLDVMKSKIPLMEGARNSLEFFRKKELPLALASNSTMEQIEAAMGLHGLTPYFETMVSGANGEAGKPHPGIYLQTAGNLGVDPSLCLAIEDSYNGVLAAKAAQMKVIALPAPHEYEQERFSIADEKIRSLAEINKGLIDKILNNE